MQTLPALFHVATAPRPHHWMGGLTAESIRRAAVRLAQSVILSGSASLIVMAAQHQLAERAGTVPGSIAPAETGIPAAPLVSKEPEPHAIAGPSLSIVGKGGEPPVAFRAPTSPADPGPSRARKARVTTGLADGDRHGATAPRTASFAVRVPLPPARAMLVEAEQVHRQASRLPAPRRPGAASGLTVLATSIDPVPTRHVASDHDTTFGAPLRYGLNLAASVGDFAVATNDRLILGTADAIGALVR